MRCLNDKTVRKIAQAPRVFFFLDYDGTLTPIASKPEKARLKKAVRATLLSLSGFPGVKIAVVSGRSLWDLQKMMGSTPGIICVGNHGLEMKGKDLFWSHPRSSQASKIIGRIWNELVKSLSLVKGMLLENKTLGISLHYRLVAEAKVANLYRDFQKIITPWVQLGVVSVHEGKKVWEIRSKAHLWNKGRVARWLLRKYKRQGGFLPVFIGDDRTDEDAFKVFRDSGITVKVTENPRVCSAAKYYVHSPDEVFDLLGQVMKARRTSCKRACS